MVNNICPLGELTRDYWVMGISVQRNSTKSVCLLMQRIFWILAVKVEPLYTEVFRIRSLETFILQTMDLFSMADLSYPSEYVLTFLQGNKIHPPFLPTSRPIALVRNFVNGGDSVKK